VPGSVGSSLRPRLRHLATATALLAATSTSVVAVTGTSAGATTPRTPHRSAAIEVFAPYQPQTICDPTPKRGVLEFRALILRTYAGTSDLGITRACSIGGRSEHKEGRAWDWGVNVHNPRQVRQVHALFDWLFATDRYGNKDAMARRLGIMYIIWNKRIWNAAGWDPTSSGGWSPYRCSGFTACHRNHVHFSFGWAGALGRTSYWTGKVAPVIPPPPRLLPDRRLPRAVTVNSRSAATLTRFALEKGHRYRIVAAGTYLHGSAPTTASDAMCTVHSDGVWRPWPEAGGPETAARFDLTVNGSRAWTPRVRDAAGCNSTGHRYVLTVTMRHTQRLRFVIHDWLRADDFGSLTVLIERARRTT
jgi:hypothetical protein